MLLPATPGFIVVGLRAGEAGAHRPEGDAGADGRGPPRHAPDGHPDVRLLGGYFVFDSPDAALLVSLLPAVVHVRGAERLSMLVRLVGDEASEQRAGRDLVLTRLVEVLLIEALRATPGDDAPPGLLRGLADARLAAAIRQMHGERRALVDSGRAREDGRAVRSAFFERFTRAVGLPPMEYLLAWRWRSPRTCCAATSSGSPRSPSASATARPAPSAPPSAGTSASRRADTRATGWWWRA